MTELRHLQLVILDIIKDIDIVSVSYTHLRAHET